ncbi:PglD-related sugar-binding protein [Phascolarctobacterium sp.]
MAKSLLIIGAGGHGKVVKEVAEAVGYDKIAFLDDNSAEAVGKIADSKQFVQEYQAAFVGIGNNKFRNELLQRLEQEGYEIPVLLHPTAYISKTAVIGKGTVVEPKAIVNANSKVGTGCIISVGAIVDHDVVLEDCVHVNAGAICKAGSRACTFRKIDSGEILQGF